MRNEVFNEYLKIINASNWEKKKSDSDYNVSPEQDLQAKDESLTEAAHKKQIQVANSSGNDGIVENNEEAQKEAIEIATIPPRGFMWNYSDFTSLAAALPLLTKIANKLDETADKESVELVASIDNLIEKLAQVKMLDAGAFKNYVSAALDRLGDLDYRDKEDQSIINKMSAYLKKYLGDFANAQTGTDKVNLSVSLAKSIQRTNEVLTETIKKSTDWGSDQTEALSAWQDLVLQANDWVSNFADSAPRADQPTQGREVLPAAPRSPNDKMPLSRHKSAPAHSSYLSSDSVKELQEKLNTNGANLNVDSTFGPKTLHALLMATKSNEYLKELVSDIGWEIKDWNDENVGKAIKVLDGVKILPFDANDTGKKVSLPGGAKKDEVMDPHAAEKTSLEQKTESYLKKLYPKVEVENGVIYAWGKESTAQNPTNFPAYKLNKQNVDTLMGK